MAAPASSAFTITALGEGPHPDAARFRTLGLAECPPFCGPDGEYLGHEWSQRRYDALDARVDAWLAEPSRGIDILDLGCATGDRAAAFARVGHRVTAVDCIDHAAIIAERSAALAVEGCAGGSLTFLQADLRDPAALAFGTTSDLVHMRRVLNFITLAQFAACLDVVLPRLKENGWFVASFIATGIKDAAEMAAPPRDSSTSALLYPGFHAHSFGDAVRILKEHGLDMIEAFTDGVTEAGLIARKRPADSCGSGRDRCSVGEG